MRKLVRVGPVLNVDLGEGWAKVVAVLAAAEEEQVAARNSAQHGPALLRQLGAQNVVQAPHALLSAVRQAALRPLRSGEVRLQPDLLDPGVAL